MSRWKTGAIPVMILLSITVALLLLSLTIFIVDLVSDDSIEQAQTLYVGTGAMFLFSVAGLFWVWSKD